MPKGYLKNTSGASRKLALGGGSRPWTAPEDRPPKPPRPPRFHSQQEVATAGGEDEDESEEGCRPDARRQRGGRGGGGGGKIWTVKHLLDGEGEEEACLSSARVATARQHGVSLRAAVAVPSDDGLPPAEARQLFRAAVERARAPLVAALRMARHKLDALDSEWTGFSPCVLARALSTESSATVGLEAQARDLALVELELARLTLAGFDAVRPTQLPSSAVPAEPRGHSRTKEGKTASVQREHRFVAVDKPDWAGITKWRRLEAGQYDPEEIDLMGERLGDSINDPVVEPCCSTPGLRCRFRQSLLERCLQSKAECPTCKLHFVAPGPQPSGTMVVQPQSGSCSGYEGCGMLVIHYDFPSGTQGPRMQNPGMHYSGTGRTVYLPDNIAGKEACALLEDAFALGMLFLVGDSVTTGACNTTVWAGIHQKTSPHGGAVGHGWPDPSYFDRLKHQCAAAGVFTDKQKRSMAAAKKTEEARAASLHASRDGLGVMAVGLSGGDFTASEELAGLQTHMAEVTRKLQEATKIRDIAQIRVLMVEQQAAKIAIEQWRKTRNH